MNPQVKIAFRNHNRCIYYCVTSKITIEQSIHGFMVHNVLLRFNNCADLRTLKNWSITRERVDIFFQKVCQALALTQRNNLVLKTQFRQKMTYAVFVLT